MRKSNHRFKWGSVKSGDVSVFWKYLCMNASLILLSVFALILSNHLALKELTKETLATMQITLERNTDMLADTLYQTYSIPSAVENTRYYGYFSEMTDDEPDLKYIPALVQMQKALRNQLSAKNESIECLLYLPDTKNIVGKTMLYPSAEKCFETGIQYVNYSAEEFCDLLEQNRGVEFFPMQEISIGGNTPNNCLTLVIKPVDSTISVISLYSEQMLLERLGMLALPEESYLRLEDNLGTVLYEYPGSIDNQIQESSYTLSTIGSKLGIRATVMISQSYFREILKPSYQIGISLVVITVLIGTALSLLFSNISVSPLRHLLQLHNPDGEKILNGNEISHLDRLILITRNEASDVRNMLADSLLMRVFSGSILSDAEELELNRIKQLNCSYRVALLHTSESQNLNVVNHLQQFDRNEMYCVILNRRESGILLLDTPEILGEFREAVKVLSGTEAEGLSPLCCGISAPAQGLENLHLAVRQARMIMPQNGGIEEYRSDRPMASNISWLQHERMYQCIFSNDEQQAMALLEQIALKTGHSNAMEVFYNIRFVIRCAAEEVELELPREQQPEFLPSMLPRENIRRLGLMLHQVFLLNQQKHDTFADTLQNQVLEYLRENFHDDRLCAAVVAEKFNIPEKRAYELVRNAAGMSFNEYVLSLRMRKAAELLCTTSDGVREIATACGYAAESTFYRAFKKYHGVPPAQYRRNGPLEDQL